MLRSIQSPDAEADVRLGVPVMLVSDGELGRVQLRKEELRKLRERQAAAVDADEEDLAREFSGAVRLTVHEQQEVTLSPDQVRNHLTRTYTVVSRYANLLVQVLCCTHLCDQLGFQSCLPSYFHSFDAADRQHEEVRHAKGPTVGQVVL